MCEKREKRLDRSLPRSPRTRSASPPDARASPHAATWPVSGIDSQLLTLGARIGASRQYAVEIVGVDFPAPDSERQIPEAVGIEPGAQTAVEHEHAAAPVRLRVEQFEADGHTEQHSVIIDLKNV